MNEYQKAYAVLRLEPGASREVVQRRYKRLIMVWHPDRYHTPEEKEYAEEELKIINNAKELLFKHFESPSHKAVGCECQIPFGSEQPQRNANSGPRGPQAKTNAGSESGPGPKQKSSAEQDAEYRDAQRKAQAAADEAAKQAAQQTQRKAYEEATQQQKTFDQENLRWKIALAEGIIFVGLSVFGWIGGGIASAVKSTVSTISNQTSIEPKKDDPCSLQGQYKSPPARIEENLTSGIKDKVRNWTVKCDGTSGGAIVEGRDDGNRLVVIQFYQGDWSVDHQDVLLTSGNDITVDRYRKPSDYVGRCVYKYDSAGHFLEVAKLDSQQNTEVTATVERTKHGKFYSLTVKPTGGNTSTYYDTDGTNVKEQFYSSSLLMNIDKYVEPPTALTGPISPSDPSAGRSSPFFEPPAPLGRGINGPSPFQVSPEKSADTPDVVRPASPFSRNDEHLKPSPFLPSSSPTPETDKLLEQIKNDR